MKVNPLRKYSFSTLSLLAAFVVLQNVGTVLSEPAAKAGKAAKESQETQDSKANAARIEANLPSSVDEARSRARWMHEGFHGALQVMHRDFFDEDDAGMLPSQSLDDVFKEMARSWSVQIRWLGVNATKGIDHEPKDRFEEKAAAALAAGAKEYEQVEAGRFRYVGMVRLQNECLKCHVRDRTTLEDRVAGLAISFPMKLE